MTSPAADEPAGKEAARARRRRAFRAVAAVLTVAAGLVVAEVALRVKHLARARRADPDAWHEHDPILGWRARPSWRGEGRTPGDPPVRFSVRTNARGLRHDREVPDRAPAGVGRIAFVGDSFTFGYGVEVEEGTVARLESALNAAATPPRPRVEVLNLGTCAYGVDQMRLVVEHEALPLAPDLVLVGVIDQNFRRALRAVSINGHAKPRFVLEDGADDVTPAPPATPPAPDGERLLAPHPPRPPLVRLTGVPVPPPPPEGTPFYEDHPPEGGSFLLWKLGDLVERVRVGLAGGAESARMRWRLGRALLLDAHRLAASRSVPLAVVLFPVRKNLEEGEPYRDLLRTLEPAVPVCDLYPDFLAAPDRDALFLPDGHPSSAGHAVAAQAIARFLVERGLVPTPADPTRRP